MLKITGYTWFWAPQVMIQSLMSGALGTSVHLRQKVIPQLILGVRSFRRLCLYAPEIDYRITIRVEALTSKGNGCPYRWYGLIGTRIGRSGLNWKCLRLRVARKARQDSSVLRERLVELRGIEPLTSWMPFMRAPSCATAPQEIFRLGFKVA